MCEEVAARIDRLREEYGEFPLHEETVENDPEYFAHGVELAEAGWLGDAGAWVTDATDRALFIRHPEDPERWGIPGGTHERGETYEETARREIREETAVDCEITGIWKATRRTIVHEDGRDRRLHVLTVLFEGRAADTPDASAAADDEVLEARWFAEPPERAHEFVEPRIEEWAN